MTAALQAIQLTKPCLGLIEQVDVSSGTLTARVARDELALVLRCQPDSIDAEDLTLTSPFRMRRRGVELKLYLGDAPPEVDRTLVQNIVKAQNWLALIIQGKAFADIAETEGISKRRIQAVVELSLLSPDVLGAIATGEQPAQLNSDYLIKTSFSAIWSEQRVQFAEL